MFLNYFSHFPRVLDDKIIDHRASAVAAGGGVYVPPTAAEYDAWMIDPTVSDAADDLEAAVKEMYAHKNLTGTGQGMAQQRAHAKRVILSNTDDTLTQSLLLAAAPRAFRTCPIFNYCLLFVITTHA